MEAVPQALADAWLTSVASSPIAGALSMLLLVFGLNWMRHAFPALLPGGAGKATAPDPEPTRQLGATLADAAESAERIAEALRVQGEAVKRQAETLERLERTLAIYLAQDRPPPRQTPVRRPAGV